MFLKAKIESTRLPLHKRNKNRLDIVSDIGQSSLKSASGGQRVDLPGPKSGRGKSRPDARPRLVPLGSAARSRLSDSVQELRNPIANNFVANSGGS
jgi:hypothetical protein